jgi:hypothetical protein
MGSEEKGNTLILIGPQALLFFCAFKPRSQALLCRRYKQAAPNRTSKRASRAVQKQAPTRRQVGVPS